MWSLIGQKITSLILVSLLLRNIFSVFFFFSPLWTVMDKVSHFLTNLRLQLQNSFFLLNFTYCFLFLVWYCLETCVNRVANCVTQKFTPFRSEFYKLFFSLSFYGQFRQLFHISEPTLWKQFFTKLNFLFSVLGSLVSKNICKLRNKLKNAKSLPELTWSWQNKPWYTRKPGGTHSFFYCSCVKEQVKLGGASAWFGKAPSKYAEPCFHWLSMIILAHKVGAIAAASGFILWRHTHYKGWALKRKHYKYLSVRLKNCVNFNLFSDLNHQKSSLLCGSVYISISGMVDIKRSVNVTITVHYFT